MRNIVTTLIILLVVLPFLLVVGYRFVPDVAGSGPHSLSNDFIFNSYIALLGFLATSAVIGPLAAQFVQWRADSEWKDARLNACDRLGQCLRTFIDQYRDFILFASRDDDSAAMFLDLTIKEVAQFLEDYDDERAAFNPAMHGAGSNIRKVLVPFKRSLETTQWHTHRRNSVRIFLHRHDLDKLRALFDKPRLLKASEPTPLERDTFFTPDEPLVIEQDPYFFKHDRLFVDASLDSQIGAGATTVYRFHGMDVASVLAEWRLFVAACRGGSRSFIKFDLSPDMNVKSQVAAHLKYLRRHVEEDYILDMLVEK